MARGLIFTNFIVLLHKNIIMVHALFQQIHLTKLPGYTVYNVYSYNINTN